MARITVRSSGSAIAIVDYGAGNLRSVQKGFEHLGYGAEFITDPDKLIRAEAVVFPGQGAAPQAMRRLRETGMDDALREYIASGRPFFGVCLGLQLLLEWSEEEGTPCLGVVPGAVKRLPPTVKAPHMGWNTVVAARTHPLFQGVQDGRYYYFVHSYYAQPADGSWTLGMTEYGVEFASALARDNIVATQFHPEKSGADGLRLYDAFVRLLVLGQAPASS